ncbi:zf-TFIIB domain-containing protein [bacterium]|nr:zf-TFIIB domain-containing protein [bacterium]
MNCPRCPGELREVKVGRGLAHVCRGCEGCWFDGKNLERILDGEQIVGTPLGVSLVGEEHGVALEAPVHCPRCARLMRRYEYGGDSQVILDACPDHGVWLDDGELGSLLEYVAIREGEFYDLPGGAALPRIPPAFWHWLGSWFRKLT